MIQFKQKEYFAPLAALAKPGVDIAVGLATNGAQMITSGIQNKKNNEFQAEMQRKQSLDSKRLAKAEMAKASAMNNLAAAAKTNPGAAVSFGNASAQIMQNNQKSFSGPSFRDKTKRVFRDGQQLIRDSFEAGNKDGKINKTIAKGIVGGLASAGLAYGVNKLLAHDARKSGLLDEPTREEKAEKREKRKKTLKRLGIGAATIAGSATLATLGAKKGMFGNKAQQWSSENLTASNIRKHAGKIGQAFGEGIKSQFDTKVRDANGNVVMKDNGRAKRNFKGQALVLGFGAGIPIANYLITKSRLKKQMEQSGNDSNEDEQKEYSFKEFKEGFKNFWKAPVRNSLDMYSHHKYAGGLEGLNNFSNRLERKGKQSMKNGGSDVTIKAAKFLKKHKNLGLLGGIGVATLLAKPWNWGNKLGRKTLDTIDTDAFAYDKASTQQVEE